MADEDRGFSIVKLCGRAMINGVASIPVDGTANPGERVIPTTRADLIRLAEVSVETGVRFERDSLSGEPMDWSLRPRRLFDGRDALEACLGEDGHDRALLVHGMGLDLDADARDLEGLFMDGSDRTDSPGDNVICLPHDFRDGRPRERSGRRLFTFQMIDEVEGGIIQAFGAMMAWHCMEVRSRLRDRYGASLADRADVLDGFDDNSSLVEALVSETVSDMLEQIAADPTSMLADGLDLRIEQMFVS
jgi:hypothetical protein